MTSCSHHTWPPRRHGSCYRGSRSPFPGSQRTSVEIASGEMWNEGIYWHKACNMEYRTCFVAEGLCNTFPLCTLLILLPQLKLSLQLGHKFGQLWGTIQEACGERGKPLELLDIHNCFHTIKCWIFWTMELLQICAKICEWKQYVTQSLWPAFTTLAFSSFVSSSVSESEASFSTPIFLKLTESAAWLFEVALLDFFTLKNFEFKTIHGRPPWKHVLVALHPLIGLHQLLHTPRSTCEVSYCNDLS